MYHSAGFSGCTETIHMRLYNGITEWSIWPRKPSLSEYKHLLQRHFNEQVPTELMFISEAKTMLVF